MVLFLRFSPFLSMPAEVVCCHILYTKCKVEGGQDIPLASVVRSTQLARYSVPSPPRFPRAPNPGQDDKTKKWSGPRLPGRAGKCYAGMTVQSLWESLYCTIVYCAVAYCAVGIRTMQYADVLCSTQERQKEEEAARTIATEPNSRHEAA